MKASLDSEWLEADGEGGYASGTTAGIRTRRYHALLLMATTPPTGRMVLVNGFDAWITTAAGTFALSSQKYAPDVTHPDGVQRITRFEPEPWPRWTYRLEDGTVVEQELFVSPGARATVLAWRLVTPAAGVTLVARPFLSGRDHHALHHENAAFRFEAVVSHERVTWEPYPDVPGIVARSNADYAHRPEWYRHFQYDEERARGLDFTEDLASPGTFTWDLSSGEAVWILSTTGSDTDSPLPDDTVTDIVSRWRIDEAVRRSGPSRLARSARAYVVRRGTAKSIIAGYPWFTDWSRDTFIAMRGLCLATGQLRDARDILIEWAGMASGGMLPNYVPDVGECPAYNSVDAPLWFVIAVHDFIAAARSRRWPLSRTDRTTLRAAVNAILDDYEHGTRYGIHCDADGLLSAGAPGVQMTWMDARVGDRVVTPRIGKPVEIQALWLNALRIGSPGARHRRTLLHTGMQSFRSRFWNDAAGYLHDVIDVDHRAGTADSSFRPNQILAVGGLPFSLLAGECAKKLVDAVEARLLTPMGLRSLAPDDSSYMAHYEGNEHARDAAYHQGTVWPWLMGPFVEAWVRVRGGTAAAKREARERFLAPLLRHLDEAGVGHISEIADGDAPFTPRGCPFQAWSVGEALRLDLDVLAE